MYSERGVLTTGQPEKSALSQSWSLFPLGVEIALGKILTASSEVRK